MNEIDKSKENKITFKLPAFVEKIVLFSAMVMVVVIAINFVTPDFEDIKQSLRDVKQSLRKEFRSEVTRIRLIGFFTTNPAVHMRESQIAERKGNIADAIDEIELALGLLELHSTDKEAKQRYLTRLAELKKKQELKQPQ